MPSQPSLSQPPEGRKRIRRKDDDLGAQMQVGAYDDDLLNSTNKFSVYFLFGIFLIF